MANDPRAVNVIAQAKPVVYCVPRRYDLATMFAISLAYAVLFGLMRLLNWSPIVFGCFAGFITLVGLGQALLFKGRAPRAASILIGVIVVGGVIGFAVIIGAPNPFSPVAYVDFIPMLLYISFVGTIIGYLAGAMVAGVFLIADGIRAVISPQSESLD